jgi:hypothetical protein
MIICFVQLKAGCILEINPADCVMRENELSISADAFAIVRHITVATDDELTSSMGKIITGFR